jgi:16S rRNA (cytosine967-C5)-methyltransferase
VTSGNPLLTPLAHEGVFFVQDEASQLVGEFVDATPGERIFDACASPGGKTTQLAAHVGDGAIVAADVRDRRVALLRRTVRESGATNVHVVQANARAVPPLHAVFDAVLVDAPCSGLGTIRRDPDVKWRRAESDLPVLAAAQAEMLNALASVVRPGGRLIYSTCSSEPEENDAIVAEFLASHPDFRRATPRHFADQPHLAALLDADGAFKTLPFRDSLEAFYAASLLRGVAGT